MFKRRYKTKIDDDDRVVKDRVRSAERTMHRAVRLLAAKPRSVGELRHRLLEKSWTDNEIVETVLEKLAEYQYLDDEKYAYDLASSKLRQRPQGKRRLLFSLKQKELENEVIKKAVEAAFEKMPEDKLIIEAIQKNIRIKGIPETKEAKQRLYGHLMRRGFSYELIRNKVAEVIKVLTEE